MGINMNPNINTNFTKIGGTGNPNFSSNATASQYGGMGNASIFGATQMADNNLEAYLDKFQPSSSSQPKTPSIWATALAGAIPAVLTTAVTLGLGKLFESKEDKGNKTQQKTETAASTKPQSFHMPDLKKASAGQLDAAIQKADLAIAANNKASVVLGGKIEIQEQVKTDADKVITENTNAASALPNDIATLEGKLKIAEAANPKNPGVINTLNADITAKKNELKTVEKAIENATAQKTNAEKEIKTLGEKQGDLTSKNNELGTNKTKCEERLREIKSQIDKIKPEEAPPEKIKEYHPVGPNNNPFGKQYA